MTERDEPSAAAAPSWMDRLIRFCIESKLVVALIVMAVLLTGAIVAPFDWEFPGIPRNPVPVDAIPDIGENQQIVFTEWLGRSPQDVEDQITYPLTTALLGIPRVKSVRSFSMFGFSTIYVIFEETAEFYWSRSRVLEKLNSLSTGMLPADAQPTLGPDATALGQVFWYTLEGLAEDGTPTGGWDLQELRSIQDWQVRYALLAAEGVSDVASIGGYVLEYQVDVDPDAMRAHNVSLDDVYKAVRHANIDVGARSIEVNKVQYLIRGVGFVKTLADLEQAVVAVNRNVPITIRNVATVRLGPAFRGGALDKAGAEAVGGVAVVRYGENPLAAIRNLKSRIERIAPGLPEKVVIDFRAVTSEQVRAFAVQHGFDAYADASLAQEDWLKWWRATPRDERPPWATLSKVTVVPFYDRTGLIYETLGTLSTALWQQMLITIIVVLIMMVHVRSSALIAAVLPLAVTLCFIGMKLFGVDANIVALSGIAIAIGTVVDMGIIVCENILRHLDEAEASGDAVDKLAVVYRAASEEGSAVLTAVATTVVGFAPVLLLQEAEGKMFKPLAYTYILVLASSLFVALTIIPAFAHLLFPGKTRRPRAAFPRRLGLGLLLGAGVVLMFTLSWWVGGVVFALALYHAWGDRCPARLLALAHRSGTWLIVLAVGLALTSHWLPLGPDRGLLRNLIVVAGLIAPILAVFLVFRKLYPALLRWSLDHKLLFFILPTAVYACGLLAWLGFDKTLGWLPMPIRTLPPVTALAHQFPGLGKEFMPSLDEGAYLLMPTTMPHASIGEALDVVQKQDMGIRQVPEVDTVVGKIGRAETPLDPAPISMVETVINYKPQFISDRAGNRVAFAFDPSRNDYARNARGEPVLAPDGQAYWVKGTFRRDPAGHLIPDTRGKPFRQWRPALDPALNPGRDAWPGIQRPDDIWDAILHASELPGTTSAPRLQPIMARIVMLQSGMRAPLGVKVFGPTLEAIEKVGLQVERFLKDVPMIEASAVLADRIIGQPYLEIDIDRDAIARYGLTVLAVQEMIEVAIGGKQLTTTIEGRERYPVRVRYLRELRDSLEALGTILISAPGGVHVPLGQIADIRHVRGPQMIRSEDTFLVGYVTFDRKPEFAEVDVVDAASAYLRAKLDSGEFTLPAGVSYEFAGSYKNQVRSQQRLRIVLPLALLVIFLILYLQFKDVPTALLVFVDIASSWMAGFILIWLYGWLPTQAWFGGLHLFGTNVAELFQIRQIHLSVAVWVGFLALFGIATDDGVVLASYLNECFARRRTTTIAELRKATVEGANKRVRACLMTTATTVIALLPVLTSTGRGADVMVPIAIPVFGGMMMAVITPIFVPVLYCLVKEFKLKAGLHDARLNQGESPVA